MKKLLVALSATTLASAPAYADYHTSSSKSSSRESHYSSSTAHSSQLFIGADALYNDTRSKLKNSQPGRDVHDDDEFNYGLNAGIRAFHSDNLFGSAELFYDDFNLSANDSYAPSGRGERFELDNRYGLKLNLGAAVTENVTPFVTIGAANVRYNINSAVGGISKTELTPLYGAGLLVDLNKSFSVRAAYDYQPLYTKSSLGGSNRNHLNIVRVGLAYNF
ncbi:MAG: hypothetical protein K0R25_1257 [Rickettsiaceae bacterium]|jgi:opacity protein-like surface antigen|nr:hypothetical protein [Rickettsiaceae bacterium]